MLSRLTTQALVLALVALFRPADADASSDGQTVHHVETRHRRLNPRGAQSANVSAVLGASLGYSQVSSSAAETYATQTSTTETTSTSTTAAGSTTDATEASTTEVSTATASKAYMPTVLAANGFTATKPAHWPTATQSGPKPTSTVASKSDPYLEELSKAIDNSGNSFFTGVHNGVMTYYGQGLGACGDVYDDSSFTAAVSRLMFDNWPGASSAQNRNPICGPFVPGRKALNSAGVMVKVVSSSVPGYAEIGGDGLINCLGSGTKTSTAQCHVPLTATVTHGSKSIQVQIVDRCVGCAVGDIDLTPAAFAALADKSLGRTSVTWHFNAW